MKKFRISFIALITVLFCASIASCSEEYSSPLKSLVVEDIVIGPEDGSTKINLGNLSSEDCANFTIYSNEMWCSAQFGIFKNVIKVKVESNETYGDRQATITVTDPEDDTTISIRVIQSQNNAIIVDGKQFVIPEEGGEITVNVQSNVSYKVDIPTDASWLTYSSSTRGLSSSTIIFKAPKNNSGDTRMAAVSLTDSKTNTVSQITIIQEFTPYITLDKEEFTLDETGGMIEVKVKSNIPLEVEFSDNWVSDGGKTDISDYNFVQKIKVSPFTEKTSSRIAKVSFIQVKQKGYSIKKSVIISQVISLSIQDNDFEILEGESYTLNLINNTGGSVTWKSSNTSVATVNSSGKVTGVSKGTAKITVTSADGKYSDQVTVTVTSYNIESYISGSAGGGYEMVAGPTGTFAGYYVSCSLKNGSTKNINVNKCTVYENGNNIGSETGFGTLKPGGSKYVEVTNRFIDITSRSYKFVWEYSYNGKTYTYTVKYR